MRRCLICGASLRRGGERISRGCRPKFDKPMNDEKEEEIIEINDPDVGELWCWRTGYSGFVEWFLYSEDDGAELYLSNDEPVMLVNISVMGDERTYGSYVFDFIYGERIYRQVEIPCEKFRLYWEEAKGEDER